MDAVDKRASDNQTRLLFSSAAFHYNTGFYKREKQRRRLTGEVDEKRQNLLQLPRFLDLNTKDPSRYDVITEYRLRQFTLCQSVYEKRSVTRLHWQKKWRTQQTVDRTVNYFATGRDKLYQKGKKEKKRRQRKKKPPSDSESDLSQQFDANCSIDDESQDSLPESDESMSAGPSMPAQAKPQVSPLQ